MPHLAFNELCLIKSLIKSLTFTRVPNCQEAILDELSILVTQFPNVIPQKDITQLDNEFLEYQCTSKIELPSYLNENKTPNRIDFIWHEIAKIINQCTVQSKFKHLPKLMKFLLSIPLSNAYCESIFSTVKKKCTDDTKFRQTCERRSAYQSATGISNNLVRL